MATEIDGRRYNWTQPICTGCYASWIGGEPHRLKEDYRSDERCAVCGNPTRDGIYFRVDPRGVPYPTPE